MKTWFYRIFSIMLLACGLSNSILQAVENMITVGLYATFPPYEHIQPNGSIIGFDIDVAQHIAQQLKRTLVIRNIPCEALFAELEKETIDCIISALTITQDRKKHYTCIHYYGKPYQSIQLLFWNNPPQNISSVEDINKIPFKKIGVLRDSLQAAILLKLGMNPTDVKEFDNLQTLLQDLKEGRIFAGFIQPPAPVDVLVKNFPSIEELLKDYPLLNTLDIPLPADKQTFGYGIFLRKEQVCLTHEIEKIIEKMKEDGTITQLEKKWITS